MNRSFAILIVCYKRLDGIERLVSSLEKVDFAGRDDISLIFSIDKSDDDRVVRFANNYCWNYGEKRVLARSEHLGLRKHILLCGDLTNEYDILVVLEDDIYVSDSMYHYAYAAADKYWDDDNIAGVSLFGFQKNWLAWEHRFEPQKTVYDAYFLKVAQSWGQVWTKTKWGGFKNWLLVNPVFTSGKDVPEALQSWGDASWLKFHDWYCMANNKYFVYPYCSLSTNFSDAGEHSRGATNDHQVELQYGKKDFCLPDFSEDAIIYDEYMNREHLGRYISVPDDQLTVDFWGTKRSEDYRRYVLTTKPLNHSVVKSFALALRPIELSVINALPGNGIWLYDTEASGDFEKPSSDSKALISYSLRTSNFRVLIPFGLRSLVAYIKQKLHR